MLQLPFAKRESHKPLDCIRTDPGWKQAWAAEQKSREIDGGEMHVDNATVNLRHSN